MTDRPVFGVTDPASVAGPDMVDCAWHPVCGHVLVHGFPSIRSEVAADLVFGRLPAEEAFARIGPCATCLPTPAEQQALDLL